MFDRSVKFVSEITEEGSKKYAGNTTFMTKLLQKPLAVIF